MMAAGTFSSLLAFLAASLQFYLDETGNILINPGFEQPLGSEWTCLGCTARLVNDSQSGNKSLLSTHRYQDWHGPVQTLSPDSGISGGHIYKFTGYAKVLPTLPGQGPQTINAILLYTKSDASQEWAYISRKYNVEAADGWVLMEAEFYTWEMTQTELSFTIRHPDPGVDFLVDSLSIVEVGDAVPESANQVLKNPGFENPIGGSGWECLGRCSETLVNDSHTGNKAYKAFNRTESWHGLTQLLQPSSGISTGRIYQFTGYVKVLPTLPDQGLQNVHAFLAYQLRDYSWTNKYVVHAHNIGADDGWVRLEAEFYTLDENQRSTYFTIRDPDVGVDFLVDSLSVVDIGEAVVEPADEVLRNPGFENPIGGSGWYCYAGCKEILVDDSHTGRKSYRAFNRSNTGQGPTQDIRISSRISVGSTYRFSGYVKVLQSIANQAPQSVRAAIGYPTSSSSTLTWVGIASAQRVAPEDGWVLMDAVFSTADNAESYISLSIDGPEAGIEFLVDTMSITESN